MKEVILKVIEEAGELHPYKVRGDYDSYSEYNQGWTDACGYIEAEVKKASSWISIKDRLPHKAGLFLIHGKAREWCNLPRTAKYSQTGGWKPQQLKGQELEDGAWEVTHWMPLPEPPPKE